MEFTLTRTQVLQLADIANKLPDTKWFTVIEKDSSGIGPVTVVKISIFPDSGESDTTIDITDVSVW